MNIYNKVDEYGIKEQVYHFVEDIDERNSPEDTSNEGLSNEQLNENIDYIY